MHEQIKSHAGLQQSGKDEVFLFDHSEVVEFSEDAIITKTLDGIIKSWNTGSEKMFGYSREEVLEKNISIIIPPDRMSEEESILQRISANETIIPYETVRIKKNGEAIFISHAVSPLKSRDGTIIGASSISRDLTSWKKAETDLINANKELVLQNEEKEKRAAELISINIELSTAQSSLHEVNKELEAFTYSVAHDLRAPLRAVNSYAQILQEDYCDGMDADGKEVVQFIRNNAQKMGALIDELLAFSRLGRKEIDRTDVDLNQLVQNVLDEVRLTLPSKISIHVGKMPTVKADSALIRQVFINLLSNAVKYSSKKEKPVIEIFTEQQNGKAVIIVKDNGAGFDMRFADKLFGVFQRLHSEKDFEGNGVGLAIVQRIISKHGGRVWGEGKEDEGATFYFTLD